MPQWIHLAPCSPLLVRKPKESGIHQEPVDQSRYDPDRKHNHHDDLLLRRVGLATHVWKEHQKESANNTERRKRSHLHVVNAFFPQLVPAVIDHARKNNDESKSEETCFEHDSSTPRNG